MTKARALAFRNKEQQVRLDLVRVGLTRQTQSLRQTQDVGVDSDRLPAESIAEQNVGGLPPHARQGQEIVEPVWNSTFEARDDRRAAALDQFCLVAVKIDFPDIVLQLPFRRPRVVARATILLKETPRDLIDKIIPRLGRENQSNQEFQRIGELEIEFRVGMGSVQDLNDLAGPGFGVRAFRSLFCFGHFEFAVKV